MKRCPECRRDYYDETLLYCLDDGTPLLEGPASAGGQLDHEPRTAILHETDPASEAQTRAQLHTTATEGLSKEPFDKRLILVPLGLAVISLSVFFGYRYLTPAKQIDSIAVLPFVNDSGNAEVEYLSDGMTETLINNLSRIPKLTVKARSAVFRYKGKAVEPNQVASDLNVQAVVNGRVTQRGDNLTVNLELVDARTGDHLWGEQYVRKVGDLIALQTDIARDVSGKLRQKLSGEATDGDKPLPKRGTDNPEAYQAYLRGRFHWNKRNIDDIDKSIEHFNRAIELDPGYALAHAGLADSYVVIPSYSNNRGKEAYPKARASAAKALEIDETLAEAHATLACVLYEYEWKFADAEREFKRSIELDPNYATGHHWYAEYLLAMGRTDEALEEIKRAQEADPLSLIINTVVGLVHVLRGDPAAGEAQLKKTLEMDPNFARAHLFLAGIYEAQYRYDEAINSYEKHDVSRGMPAELAAKSWERVRKAYRADGAKGYHRALLALAEESAQKDPVNGPPLVAVARLHTLAGNDDKAFEYLERSYQEREPDILQLDDPVFNRLRSDPRFKDLTRRIGLPD